MTKESVKIGIIQSGAVYFNLEKTMIKAEAMIEEAAAKGAQLVVCGETWLSGYPAWLDYCPEVGFWNHEPTKEAYAQMYGSSIQVPGKETEKLGELAKKHKLTMVIGINEIVETGIGNGTIYNSLLIIDDQGEIANHHRKLMPTFTEKLVYGIGDGHGLQAVDTSFGRLGGLICWEHWMPLTRQVMHNSNEHIHVAVWPTAHEIHQMASRHYAFEGRCYVVAVGQMMCRNDIPSQLKLPPLGEKESPEWLLRGGSSIIGPDGQYVMEPQFDTEGVFIHEIKDLSRVYKERMTLDTSGHYNRSDVFDFRVNRERK
jgi:nitrilase